MLTAKDIMTKKVVTVKKALNIKELSKLFIEHNVNGLPVVDDEGKVVGIVTQSDLIEQSKSLHIPTVISLFDAVIFIDSEKKFESDLKKLTGTRVEHIYSSKVVTVPSDTEVGEVASIMSEKNIHTIPVMEGEELIGVIGKLDLIRGMA